MLTITSLRQFPRKQHLVLKLYFMLSKACCGNFPVAWRANEFFKMKNLPLSWWPLSTAVDRLMSSTGKTSSIGKNSARLLLPFFCLRLHSVSAVQPSFPGHMSQVTPQGRWFVCFTVLHVQKHFLTSNLNLPQWHIKLLGFYPIQHEHGKQITSFLLQQQLFTCRKLMSVFLLFLPFCWLSIFADS